MGFHPPLDTKQRYSEAVEGVMQCPSNKRRAGPVQVYPLRRLISDEALAPSYATSRFFMYVGTASRSGSVRGTLWWSEDCVPAGYLPRFDRLNRPQAKTFLADAHVVSITRGQIANANWGFSSQGAWRVDNYADPGPVSYRGDSWYSEIWRHGKAINILAYDGHVQLQRDVGDQNGLSRPRAGYGDGARKVTWWFPSGTNIEKLPSKQSDKYEPGHIVVP
jgi:prepilin-type processing-associated H-X9-DG protein